MSIKRYNAEQIVTLLRQIEVGIANGKTTPRACEEIEIKKNRTIKLTSLTRDPRRLVF